MLAEDPAESNNLSDQHPGKVADMAKMWQQYKVDNMVLDVSLDLTRGFE